MGSVDGGSRPPGDQMGASSAGWTLPTASRRYTRPRGFSAEPGAAHPRVVIMLSRTVFSTLASSFCFLKEIKKTKKQKSTPPHFPQSTVASSDLGT